MSTKSTDIYRCSNRSCKARIVAKLGTEDYITDVSTLQHNHLADKTLPTKQKLIELVEKNNFAKPQQIINKVHASSSGDNEIPNDSSMRKEIQYMKRKLYPAEPKSLNKLSDLLQTNSVKT